MSSNVAHVITNESITVIWEGKSIVVRKESPNYLGLKNAIQEERWDDISRYVTVPKSLESWSNNQFTIGNGTVSYQGEVLPGDITARIIEMSSNGEDPTPLFKFWERLQRNPSFRSVKQLFGFLQNKNIPIIPNGCFLAYKRVKEDYKDVHSGLFDNHPGVVNAMPRNRISDDPNVACHDGFHVGAYAYANSFNHGSGRVVICKIDPEDVVCVPYDHSQQKMRVCKYAVVGNYGAELPSTVFDDPLPMDSQEDLREDSTPTESSPKSKPRSAAATETLRNVAKINKTKKLNSKTRALIEKLNKLQLPGLMEYSIEELRQYATYGVEIVGASKIPGGKVALVERILKSR